MPISDLPGPAAAPLSIGPGRFACIEALRAEVETLAEAIRDLAETAWNEHAKVVDASYEEMDRA